MLAVILVLHPASTFILFIILYNANTDSDISPLIPC